MRLYQRVLRNIVLCDIVLISYHIFIVHVLLELKLQYLCICCCVQSVVCALSAKGQTFQLGLLYE